MNVYRPYYPSFWNRTLAVPLVLAMFFILSVETFHAHSPEKSGIHHSGKYLKTANVKCKICDYLSTTHAHQLNYADYDHLILPMNPVRVIRSSYIIQQAEGFLLSCANKGPPSGC